MPMTGRKPILHRLLHLPASTAIVVSVGACTAIPGAGGFLQSDPVTLARPGDSGIHTYRIPALAVTTDGTLLATYDARRDSDHDLPGNIDIVLRRSHDNGRTWSAPRHVVHDGRDGVGTGDSSLLVDRDTGRVFLFYAWGPRGIGFSNSQPGNSLDNTTTLHPRYVWSDDNGNTWQGPRDLIATIKRPEWRGMFATSGHGVQLFNNRTLRGRLIQPYAFRTADGLVHAVNAWSDDHGTTWHVGEPIPGKLDESKAVELADGTVMQNIRSSDSAVHARMVARSVDGGIHFDDAQPEPELPDPHDNADIIRVAPVADPGHPEAHWLLFSNTADPHERRRLTVRLSRDNGRTWNAGCLITAGDAMYSVMARLPDGTFGIFYESAGGRLDFARFNLLQISRGCR